MAFRSIVMVALFLGSAEEVKYFPYAYRYLSISRPHFFHELKWGPLPAHEWYSLGVLFCIYHVGGLELYQEVFRESVS